MNLEEVIERHKREELFDESYLRTIIESIDHYTVYENLITTLKETSKPENYTSEIYTLQKFLDYKNDWYDTIVKLIGKQFKEGDMPEKFDLEILNWIEDDWQEEHDSEYDYYLEHSNGEAEDVIYGEMITFWENEYNQGNELSIDDHSNVRSKLEDKYQL